MKAIVDNSVWSLTLRIKQPDSKLANILQDLIANGRVIMIGAIRQEILSGIKHQKQFEKLRDNLRAFPNLLVLTQF